MNNRLNVRWRWRKGRKVLPPQDTVAARIPDTTYRCRAARSLRRLARVAFMVGGTVGCHKTKCFVHPWRGVRAARGSGPTKRFVLCTQGAGCWLQGWPACRVRRAGPAPMRARPLLRCPRPLLGRRSPTRMRCARCARITKRPRRSSPAVSSFGLFRPQAADAACPRSGRLWWCWARPGLRAFGRTPPGGLEVPAPGGGRGLSWFAAPGLVPPAAEKSGLLDKSDLLQSNGCAILVEERKCFS